MRRNIALLTCVTATSIALAGCGGATAAGGSGDKGLDVVAAFYPLQFVTERVAGDRATVTNLTTPGAEPHDLELTPRAVADLGDADLVVYEDGFQPAVDDAVESEAGDNAMDVAPSADLDLTYSEDPHEGEEPGAHAEEEGEAHEGEEPGAHAEEEGEAHEGEEPGAHAEEEGAEVTDPHFWLDPTRLASVAEAVSARLTELDPDGAETYTANAEELTAELATLDGEFEEGLASCTKRAIVTSHEAFGYLANAYDLEQVGISGLSPDEEPDAGQIAEVTDFVRANDVGTIYFETLVSPDIAETVATETGAQTAVLDPLEGLTDDSAGGDYLEVMRANLESLRTGQSCP